MGDDDVVLSYEWAAVPVEEEYCTVTVKYVDLYDIRFDGSQVLKTMKDCHFMSKCISICSI